MDRTSAAKTTTHEANSTVAEVRGGHTTVTLPSGIVIRDGKCDALHEVIDGQRSYPGVRFATDDVGYSPAESSRGGEAARLGTMSSPSTGRCIPTVTARTSTTPMNVSTAKQEVGMATVVVRVEVINAHSWLGYLPGPPASTKIGEVTVDITRNNAVLPEGAEGPDSSIGSTTVTSEPVYSEVDDNAEHLGPQRGPPPERPRVWGGLHGRGPVLPSERWDGSSGCRGRRSPREGQGPACSRSAAPGEHRDRAGLLGPCEQVPGVADSRGHQRVHRRGLRGLRQGRVCRHARGCDHVTRIEGTRCPVEGTYTSMIFDAGRTTTFGTATWTADVPSGTSLRFQVAVSSMAGGPWVFVGPDGTAGSSFTSSGTAFTTPPTGRYVRYQATFASDAGRVASPTLSGFNLSLGGATSRVVSYTYGANGNVVRRTTVDSATGTTTDVRDSVTWPASDRINTQDQLLRRDVTSPDGTTTTWRYTYDSAGNMTSKTDWTQTTSYAWDSHNRLVQVTQPDGTTEAYTYDAIGLMLSSRRSTDTAAATYVWRGNDLVQETAPDGTVTRYNVVNGVLVSFERGGQTYTVQSEATLGHVRSVTDTNGTVVYIARYDAWGDVLAVTDNVPGGVPYRYVGSLGVRWDAGTGLYYMRHRWYDPGVQQFMSVDPLRSNPDPYEYANDGPLTNVDPLGLRSDWPWVQFPTPPPPPIWRDPPHRGVYRRLYEFAVSVSNMVRRQPQPGAKPFTGSVLLPRLAQMSRNADDSRFLMQAPFVGDSGLDNAQVPGWWTSRIAMQGDAHEQMGCSVSGSNDKCWERNNAGLVTPQEEQIRHFAAYFVAGYLHGAFLAQLNEECRERFIKRGLDEGGVWLAIVGYELGVLLFVSRTSTSPTRFSRRIVNCLGSDPEKVIPDIFPSSPPHTPAPTHTSMLQ